jgi:hypothetical protein
MRTEIQPKPGAIRVNQNDVDHDEDYNDISKEVKVKEAVN